MSTAITAVDTEINIEHGVLIDLVLDGVEYNISNCYKTVSYNSKTYTALAGFLNLSEIQSNISSTNDDIQIGLSGIPGTYISAILGQPIKGGMVNIYRAFFDYNTQEVLATEIYKRFTGVIVNFSVQEDMDISEQTPNVTHTITVIASSIMGVLENRYTGRRTNPEDFAIVYSEIGNSGTDPSMDRVMTLHNAAFDFGKPYTAKTPTPGSGGSNAPSGGNDQQQFVDQP